MSAESPMDDDDSVELGNFFPSKYTPSSITSHAMGYTYGSTTIVTY